MNERGRFPHLVGSIIGARSAIRGPSFPVAFRSHPTAAGIPSLDVMSALTGTNVFIAMLRHLVLRSAEGRSTSRHAMTLSGVDSERAATAAW